jgi:two-component system, OmpR family, sensor kinase
VSRLPLRLRLALVFALAMAVVLMAVGAVLYLSVREALDDQIAENALDRVEATEERDETLATLLTLLLVVGPIALLLASLAGYLLAGAALRPVEAMRRGAAEISASTSGRRLPLPPASDEVRRLGETLNAMLARLDEGLERERRFVADAGHELRTPLATLRFELELALRQPRPSEELVAALRSAAEEVERLVRLAEDLLVLSRDGEGGPPLRRTRVEVSDLLETVAARFRRDDRAIKVVVPAGLVLEADRIRLEQALGNLVDNALRHGRGTVRLLAEAGEGEVVFRVRDEGLGLPPEFAPRAFERFSRADAARSGGGAGLGLAIVAAVARAHGGRVSADGAEVTLAIPHRALIPERERSGP